MTQQTLAQLIQPATTEELLALELAFCTAFGLPTTAWQPVQAIPVVLNTNAAINADASQTVAFIAQGGFASLAALMVNSTGQPITSWMDLIAQDLFGIVRIQATPASGNVPVLNSSGIPQSWSNTSPLRFGNPVSGATYTTTGSGTIAASGTSQVFVQADAAFVGSVGTSGAGVTLVMLTPFPGVTVQPLVNSLIGSDAETNSALLIRGQGRIAAISPNGAAQAYNFIATSIPQGTPSAVPPYQVSSVITRATTHANANTGTVTLIVANSVGSPNATDLNVVNSAIQASVVPSSVTAIVEGATDFNVQLTFIVYIKASTNISATSALTNIEDALANLFAGFPIGGYNANVPGFNNYIPYDLVVTTIMDANPGTVDLNLDFFPGSGIFGGQIAVTDVPFLLPSTGTVVFIQAT